MTVHAPVRHFIILSDIAAASLIQQKSELIAQDASRLQLAAYMHVRRVVSGYGALTSTVCEGCQLIAVSGMPHLPTKVAVFPSFNIEFLESLHEGLTVP